MASCLNEECTNMVKGIYEHLEEAKKCYDALPKCIRRNADNAIDRADSLGIILAKGIKVAAEFKNDFEIE